MKRMTGPVCDDHRVPIVFGSWVEKREHDKQFHRKKFMARLQREKEIKKRQQGAREDQDIWQEYYGGMRQ